MITIQNRLNDLNLSMEQFLQICYPQVVELVTSTRRWTHTDSPTLFEVDGDLWWHDWNQTNEFFPCSDFSEFQTFATWIADGYFVPLGSTLDEMVQLFVHEDI